MHFGLGTRGAVGRRLSAFARAGRVALPGGLLTLAFLVLLMPWSVAQQKANPLTQMPEAQKARQSSTDQDQSSPTFRVNVKLVNVFATVVDQNGAPVGGLTKQDFTVLEDDKPQKIAVFNRESGLPLSIVLEVDTSLSTHKDLQLELQSARRFTHTILRPVDALALFQFSEIVDELTPFTADLRRIDNAIDHVHPGAATAMYDALYLGARALGRRQGRKVMVVITDGGDTVSTTDYSQALRAAQEAEAIVYSIIVVPIEADAGRDIGGEHALIQISHDTGGKYFYAEGINQLDEAFRKISDELRTQYLLAYYPSERVSDSDFRRIRILVKTPADKDWTVRARTGYYTSKAE
ncbi:MAG TPA: VWA domain-containing protein [Terriglobales bacterium]|nr:VWA domain-containing protein [Terriglobales bacterium]